MSTIEEMQIDLRSLTADETQMDFRLDADCLRQLAAEHGVHGGDVLAKIRLTRVGESEFALEMDIDGQLEIPCDRCLADMQQHVSASESLTVRLTTDDVAPDDEDTICVSERSALLDLSWPVMEAALLAIPLQHVHETGLCDREMVKALEEHSAARSGEGETTGNALGDAWKETLKQIKIN